MIKKLEECVDAFLSQQIFTEFINFYNSETHLQSHSPKKLRNGLHSRNWFTDQLKSNFWIFDVLFPQEDDDQQVYLINEKDSFDINSITKNEHFKFWKKFNLQFKGKDYFCGAYLLKQRMESF